MVATKTEIFLTFAMTVLRVLNAWSKLSFTTTKSKTPGVSADGRKDFL